MYTHDEIIIAHLDNPLGAWSGEYAKKILSRIAGRVCYSKPIRVPDAEKQFLEPHQFTASFATAFEHYTALLLRALTVDDCDIVAIPLEVLPVTLPPPLYLCSVINRNIDKELYLSQSGFSFQTERGGSTIGVYAKRQFLSLQQKRPDMHYRIISPDIRKAAAEHFYGCDAVVFPHSDVVRLTPKLHGEVIPEQMLYPAFRSGIGCVVDGANTFLREMMRGISDENTIRETLCEDGFLSNFNPPFDASLGGYARAVHNNITFFVRSIDAESKRIYEKQFTGNTTDPYSFGRDCADAFEKIGGRVPLSLHRVIRPK